MFAFQVDSSLFWINVPALWLQLANGTKLVAAVGRDPLAVALLPEHVETLAVVVGLGLCPITVEGEIVSGAFS